MKELGRIQSLFPDIPTKKILAQVLLYQQKQPIFHVKEYDVQFFFIGTIDHHHLS